MIPEFWSQPAPEALDLHLTLMSITHEILVHDSEGWTSWPYFLHRYALRTGSEFEPRDFGYIDRNDFIATLQGNGLVYTAKTITGVTMLCPRGALTELTEPIADIHEAVRRYYTGRSQ